MAYANVVTWKDIRDDEPVRKLPLRSPAEEKAAAERFEQAVRENRAPIRRGNAPWPSLLRPL